LIKENARLDDEEEEEDAFLESKRNREREGMTVSACAGEKRQ
jgi:hypothetical protein